MWFGTATFHTSGGGVSRYDGEMFVNFNTEYGLAHDRVNSIDHDSNGTLGFGTYPGVSKYDR